MTVIIILFQLKKKKIDLTDPIRMNPIEKVQLVAGTNLLLGKLLLLFAKPIMRAQFLQRIFHVSQNNHGI